MFLGFANIRPYRTKISKRYSSYKIVAAKIFVSMVLTKLRFSFFCSFEFPICNEFYSNISNSPLQPMEKSQTSIIWKTSDRRGNRSGIWDSRVVLQHIWVLWPCSIQCHFEVIGCTCDFSRIRFPENTISSTNHSQNL